MCKAVSGKDKGGERHARESLKQLHWIYPKIQLACSLAVQNIYAQEVQIYAQEVHPPHGELFLSVPIRTLQQELTFLSLILLH